MNNIRSAINKWLWEHKLAKRKQFPDLIPHEKFTKSTQRGRFMLLGFIIGLVPYIVHIQGWLR